MRRIRFRTRAWFPAGAAALLFVAAAWALVDDNLKFKADAVDQGLLMKWHDRAFGQAKLAIARKEKDSAALHAWLLAQMADENTRQTEDAQYITWARELKQHAMDMFTAAGAEDWDKAREAAKATDETCKKCHDVHAKDE